MPSRATRAADKIAADTTVKPDTAAVIAALTAAGVSEADIAKMIKSTQPKPPKLNSRKIVATALIKVAADMVESWDNAEVSAEDARTLVARWLGYIPASEWDARLGERSLNGRKPKAETTDDTDDDSTE